MGNISKNTNKVGMALIMLVTSFILPLFTQNTEAYHNIIALLCISSYLMCLYVWISTGNRIISVFSVFILYAFLSNMGQTLLYVLGVDDLLVPLYTKFTLTSIIKSLEFQYQCIAALTFGVSWFLKKPNNIVSAKTFSETIQTNSLQRAPSNLYYWLMILCLLLISFGCFNYLVAKQTMSYEELYNQTEVLGEMPRFLASILCIYFLFKYSKDKRTNYIIYAFFIFFIVSLFIVGRRSIAILFVGLLCVCLPITHPQLFKKRYAWFWIVGIMLFISSISLLSECRKSGFSESSGLDSHGFILNLVSSIAEFGASEKPLLLTMEGVEHGTPHYQTIIYQLLHGFLPSFVLDILGSGSKWNISLSAWVTDYDNSYSGLGYSFIAEAYMNYGWFGWLFIMFYGWFIAWAENTSYKRIMNGRYILAAILLTILCRQIFFARGNLLLINAFYKFGVLVVILAFMHPRLRKIL